MSGYEKNTVSLYLKDRELFNSLCNDIKKLWYEEYKENLHKTDIIMKAITLLQKQLKTKTIGEQFDSSGQIRNKYGRIGQ